MRIKHFLRFVALTALTLMAIQRMPSVAAVSQTESSTSQVSSQFTSDESGGDLRQSAFDPLGYDSGLWRSEYLGRQNDDKNADRQLIPAPVGTQSAPRQAGTSHHRRDDKFGSSIFSDHLAMIPVDITVDIPVVIRTPEPQGVGESDPQSATTMSDWEFAAATATGSATIGFTKSVPSVTSAIVGFVGIVIVIGAYVSSIERKP